MRLGSAKEMEGVGNDRDSDGKAEVIPRSWETNESTGRFVGRPLGRVIGRLRLGKTPDRSESRGTLVGSGSDRESPGNTDVIPRICEIRDSTGMLVASGGNAVVIPRICERRVSTGRLVGRDGNADVIPSS